MYTVYALADPRTEEVHYIGCTLDVKRRFNDHLNDKKGNAKKRAWIDSLKKENLLPVLSILEEGLKEPDVWFREAYWIQQHIEQKAPLTNTRIPNPDKAVKRHRSIYYTVSQEHYDHLVSLGREAVLMTYTEEGNFVMPDASAVAQFDTQQIPQSQQKGDPDMKPIVFSNQRILTTQQLAEFYGTDTKHLNDNFQNNKDRYTEEIDYFALKGEELKCFKEAYPEISGNLKFAPVIYLWTESGTLMHAKSINTDTAWKVYRHLVETYFRYQEQVAQPQEPPLAGDDFLSDVRTLLHVPTLQELRTVERYIRAAKALYQQKDEGITAPVTKQLSAPKADRDAIEQLQFQILKHLNNHGPLTFNTLYHSYMKNRDEMATRKALDVLVEQGVVQKEITNRSIRYSIDAASQQA